MPRPPHQGLMKRLAMAAIAVTAGGIEPARALAELPSDALEDVVEDTLGPRWRGGDRSRVLGLLAQDARPEVRGHVAEATSALWPERQTQALLLLRVLARDPDRGVRVGACRGLSQLLQRAAPLDRTQIVADWTLSRHAADRAAIATVLGSRTLVYLADVALAQLASDTEPSVRWLALRAARERWREDPVSYSKLALERSNDPDGRVRRSARKLFGRIAAETAPDEGALDVA